MRDLYEREGGRIDFNQRILSLRPTCEAGLLIGTFLEISPADARRLVDGEWAAARIWSRCTRFAQDVHEILSRSAGGDILDEKNVLAVCRACHEWIGANRRNAEALGLRRSRYPGEVTIILDKGDRRLSLVVCRS
jgi:hypothetical protein